MIDDDFLFLAYTNALEDTDDPYAPIKEGLDNWNMMRTAERNPVIKPEAKDDAPTTFNKITDAVADVATKVMVDPIIKIAAAVPPPKPQPKRQDLCGVEVNGIDDTVRQIFDPDMPLEKLVEHRQYYIDSYAADLRFEICPTNIAQQLRIGDRYKHRRLDIMEEIMVAAYRKIIDPTPTYLRKPRR